MENLLDMAVFARVVERRSLTATGKELQMSTSAVSKHVARLEEALSFKLVERSTHSMRPTESGGVYYEHCVRILAAVESARSEASGLTGEMKGVLRVHSTHGVGLNFVAPATIDFAKLHGSVTVHLSIGEFPTELTNRGLDVIIASRHFGHDDPRVYDTLIARDLGSMPYIVCASPKYLARHGTPAHPTELERRACLVHLTQKRNPDEWFFNILNRKFSVIVNNVYSSNLESAVLMAALEGLGIARLPEYTARRCIMDGRLISLFDGSVQSGRMIKAFYSRGRYVPRKIRAFIDLLQQRYGQSSTATQVESDAASID